MILHINIIMTCSRVSMMRKHANLWIQMDHILSVWPPSSMQMIIHLSRKSCPWMKSFEMSDLMPWKKSFKIYSNPKLSNLSVGMEVLKQGEEIVPTTWAFRKKCHPSGEGYCFKAHVRMHGDLQRENCSNNKTFGPVMEWVTMRMLFSLSIMEGWSTASIDFKNTFAQATLPKAIYVKLPQGHVQANPGDQDKVMKIKKSLYGDCRAANLWCP